VAVIADKPGIIVVFLDVIGDDVVIVFARPGNARSEFGQAYVRVSPDPAVRYEAIVPMVAPDEFIILERVGRGDGENVPDAGIVIDGKSAIIAVEYLECPTAPGEIVFPRFPGEQNPGPAVSIDPEHRDIAVGFRLEVDSGVLSAPVGIVVPIGPEADTLTFG
jgi:hypothetical protein